MSTPAALRSTIRAALPTLDWASAGIQDTAQLLEVNLPKFTAALGVSNAFTLFPSLLNSLSFELLEFSNPQPKQFLLEFNLATGTIPLPVIAPDFFEVSGISFGAAIDLNGTPPLDLFIKASGNLAGTAVTLTAELAGSPQIPDDLIDASLDFGNLTLAPIFQKLNVPGGGFEDLRLASIEVACPIPADYVRVDVVIDDVWRIPLGQQNVYFTLDQLGLSALYLTGEEGGLSGSVGAVGHLDDIDFEVVVQYLGGDGGWDLFGKAGNIPVGKVLEKFGLAADSPFTDMVVNAVALHYNTASNDFGFSFSGHTPLSDTVTAAMTAEVKITSHPGGDFEKFFSGKVAVGPIEFDLVFDQDGASQDFIGVFQNTGGASVSVVDVIKPLIDVPSGLGDLNLNIKEALLAYQSTTDTSGAKKTNYLFAFDTDLTVDLSGLNHVPLIGQALPAGQKLDLAFQVLAHSDGFNADGSFRKLLPKGSPVIPDKLQNTFQVLTTLRIGDFCKQIDLSIEPSDVESKSKPSQSTNLPAAPPAAKADNPQKSDVQRHFGPLNIESVAVAFDKAQKTIAILLSGSLSVTGLDLALDGLAGSYNLSTREITFGLKGLSIDFKRGELEIGGGFLNVEGDFAGKVIIKTKTFSLAALGAVAVTEGQPSIFIYGFLNYPLGGPAFFYVEGLAAGFGYNRGFIPPAISDVRSFPLVQDAASLASGQMLSTKPKAKDEITNQLTRLHEFIPPSNGEYFFSAGIKFSSFKMLNSFLLVTVVAGERFEIDVLGISTYQNPPITVDGVPALAHIELNVVGRIAPDEGFAGIQAQLTDASYIYSGLCKVAGGFAFFTWFAPSPLAGDFVLSVGGYHPAFSKPAHYPDVPRVSLAYQITENIFVKGSAYFALTPTVLMAGAALEARATIGSLEAWFTASLDFMIGWEPYHYEASLNVSIGARWTIFHTELNAQLEIWGPEFSGLARVSWTIFSFDVSFGGARTGPSPIAFDRFRDQFLESDADRTARKKLLFVRVLEGATGSVKQGAAEIVIVNPAQLRLETSSPIPSRTVTLNGKAGNPDFTLSAFGVAPMDVDDTKLSVASHAVDVKRNGTPFPNSNLVANPLKQTYPPALWHTALTVPSDAPMISAIGGLAISAPPAHVLPSVSVKRSDLDFSIVGPIALSAPVSIRYTSEPAMQNPAGLQSSFVSASASSARTEMLRSLGFDPVTLVSISPSLADAFDYLPAVVSA